MHAEIKTFTTKSGKEKKYISIDHISKDGKPYKVGLGLQKAQAVLNNASEVAELLKAP